jgi:ABC-2 type transport system permease protein
MFNSVFVKATDMVELAGATVTAHAHFAAGMLGYAIMLAGFNQLAIGLVTQRETGQLKRLRGTPLPAWTFIAATVLCTVVTVGLMAVLLLAIARLAYGLQISGRALAKVLLYVSRGTATMCCVGIAATA